MSTTSPAKSLLQFAYGSNIKELINAAIKNPNTTIEQTSTDLAALDKAETE